ncbi:MAG: hypothetical protein EX271_00330 [Acidimicrobiales bacterium]|nr:hypothetical protein [Hyphomonadaceae bacterium]RZV45027.1 MAG: hypothetical protein EX271_00330 [Acidimicrobiales bacterium]
MSIFNVVQVVIVGLFLSACSLSDLEESQTKEFAELMQNFKLTPAEVDIAQRTVSGYKNEMGTPVVASRDLRQAICYATSVQMPEKYTKAHLLYLEYYAEADKDYYTWFAKKGISAATAEAMGNIYVSAHDKCKTMQGRLKNLKTLKKSRGL